MTMDMTIEGAGGFSDGSKAAEHLNSLLRGEISAAETYRMAIDTALDSKDLISDAALLRAIQAEHGRAAQALRERIRDLGGEASDSSGAWGAWAKTVQGTMNIFGDASALKSLKEGEQHGLNDYQAAIEKVDTMSADLIENELIPNQVRHVNLLDQMIDSVGTMWTPPSDAV